MARSVMSLTTNDFTKLQQLWVCKCFFFHRNISLRSTKIMKKYNTFYPNKFEIKELYRGNKELELLCSFLCPFC